MYDIDDIKKFIYGFKTDKVLSNVFFNFKLYNSQYNVDGIFKIFFNNVIYEGKVQRFKSVIAAHQNNITPSKLYHDKLLTDALLSIINNSFLSNDNTLVYLLDVQYTAINDFTNYINSKQYELEIDFIKIII